LHAWDGFDDEGAGPTTTDEQAFFHEFVDRLAHCDAADIGRLGDVAFGRECVAMLQATGRDGVLDHLAELDVKRSATDRLKLFQGKGRAHAVPLASCWGTRRRRVDVQSVISMFPSLGGLCENNTNQKPISQMVLKRVGSITVKCRNFIVKTAICTIYLRIPGVLALRLD